jgi:diketogulonate reductase-like aldo/keto reductase
MTILNENYTLSNGLEIPKLGLGTWFIDDALAADAVKAAIGIGYRNIDTAQAYGNEHGVGEGVRTSGVARDELFVSTKLAAEIKDHDAAVTSIEGSLQALGLDYIDLMLIHSPQPWNDFRGGDYADGNRQAWRALEEAHQTGKIRSIGVSNFLQEDLDSLLETAAVVPHVNQLLVHAGNTPSDLLSYCEGKGILVEAYSPIGHGAILKNPEVKALAEKYSVTVPQLCIRYTL